MKGDIKDPVQARKILVNFFRLPEVKKLSPKEVVERAETLAEEVRREHVSPDGKLADFMRQILLNFENRLNTFKNNHKAEIESESERKSSPNSTVSAS